MAKQERERGRVLEQSRKYRVFRTRLQEQQRRVLFMFAGLVVVVLVLLLLGMIWEYVLVPRKVVARVNGESIYVRDFQARVKFHRTLLIRRIGSYLIMYQQFQSAGLQMPLDPQIQAWVQLLDDPEAMGEQVLDSMIQDVLIRQEMERRGITVTEEEIDKAIQEAFGYYPEGTPTPEPTATPWATSTLSPTQIALLTPDVTPTPTEGPSPTPTLPVTPTATPEAVPTLALEETPAGPTPTPYTEQLFQENLKAFLKDTGLSMADLRALFRDMLYREKFLKLLSEDVSKEEEQVWVRHILVPEEEVAKDILERLQKGESWFLLAQQYSEDRSTAEQGGDLGWIARGDTVKPFEDVAFALEVGEISGIVATPYGWHILQVLGKEVRPLRDDQLQQRIQERFEVWLAEARAQADIEIYDDVWMKYVPDKPELPPQFRLVLSPPTPALQPVTVQPPATTPTPAP